MSITQLNVSNGTASAIQYSVVKNRAASAIKGNAIFNAVTTTPTKSLQDVAKRMVEGGSKYAPHEIVSMLTHFADVVAKFVTEGNAVNVGSLMRIRPSIRGTFETEEEHYDDAKQRIVVATSTGSLLRDVAAKATVRRIDGKTLPEILTVLNNKTFNTDTISTNGALYVTGKRLDWDENNEEEGWFLLVNDVASKLTVKEHPDK